VRKSKEQKSQRRGTKHQNGCLSRGEKGKEKVSPEQRSLFGNSLPLLNGGETLYWNLGMFPSSNWHLKMHRIPSSNCGMWTAVAVPVLHPSLNFSLQLNWWASLLPLCCHRRRCKMKGGQRRHARLHDLVCIYIKIFEEP
jgi:hypothetical protein